MRKIILIFLMLLFIFCSVSQAAIIEIGLIGQVDYVDDPYNLLENGVHQGDSITGFYTYDSATPDTNPSTTIGTYVYSAAPFGISLTVGGLTFQTDPANVDFMIGIANGIESGGGGDRYWILSYNNLDVNNNVTVSTLDWQLTDYSYTAISSTELLDVPPDLSAWQSGNNLGVRGGRGGMPPCFDETFGIDVYVTSVYLIPEPTTLLLFGLGGLILRKRG